jgi:hypothetical protein
MPTVNYPPVMKSNTTTRFKQLRLTDSLQITNEKQGGGGGGEVANALGSRRHYSELAV